MSMAEVNLNKEHVDKALKIVNEGFAAAKAGTLGDHSDTGFLTMILLALDVEPKAG